MKYKSCRKTTKCNIYDENIANTIGSTSKHIFFVVKLLNSSSILSIKYKQDVWLRFGLGMVASKSRYVITVLFLGD